MTPDRHDDAPEEGTEHGVLDDTGTVESAGIGILGTGTAQVRVVLPFADDDDLVADDVVDDEVHETDQVDELDTGDIILEDLPVDSAAPAVEAEDAVEVVESPDRTDAETDADITSSATGSIDVTLAQAFVAAAAADAARAASASAETEPAPPAETEPKTAGALAAADRIPIGAPVPVTGSLPTTRREVHHAAEVNRGERAHAIERVHTPGAEQDLSAKRLGELSDGRESSDLLTADRLLDRAQLSGAEPEGVWQQLVYTLSGHRINLGDSRRARARKDLDRKIAAPLVGGARFVPVLSRKGGVGKTTVTTLLGMALASARDDRVIAVDANPDRGTLADRIGRPSGRTVRDLARTRAEVSGYNDISTIVARDETRLDVLASDADPRVSEAFSDRDYHDVAALAAHYYSIVLTDTGTGIVHSVMGATLELSDTIVVVAGLSVDEARLAAETLTWLETNGYADKVRGAVVVLNNARPGAPLVRESELEAHFRTRVRAVVRMPYDPLIGTGSAISFRDLQPATRRAARELAAAVVEGLRALAPAA